MGGICVASLNVGARYHHQIILPPMHTQHTESFPTAPPFSFSAVTVRLLQQPHQQHPPRHPRHAAATAPPPLPSSASCGPRSCRFAAARFIPRTRRSQTHAIASQTVRISTRICFKKKRLLPLVSMLLFLFPSSSAETHLDWKLVGGGGIGAG